MTRFSCTVVGACLLFIGNDAPCAADFYVSPRGKDVGSGRQMNPLQEDGRFATIGRAQQAVRALLRTKQQKRPILVELSGGTYYLDSPIQFGPEDSGSAEA